jgi:hypothetical protein
MDDELGGGQRLDRREGLVGSEVRVPDTDGAVVEHASDRVNACWLPRLMSVGVLLILIVRDQVSPPSSDCVKAMLLRGPNRESWKTM